MLNTTTKTTGYRLYKPIDMFLFITRSSTNTKIRQRATNRTLWSVCMEYNVQPMLLYNSHCICSHHCLSQLIGLFDFIFICFLFVFVFFFFFARVEMVNQQCAILCSSTCKSKNQIFSCIMNFSRPAFHWNHLHKYIIIHINVWSLLALICFVHVRSVKYWPKDSNNIFHIFRYISTTLY